jgi:hypothetical protein
VALHAIARVRLATGRAAEAVTPAKLAVAAAADAGERARALVTLSRVYFELGADESAENVARKAVDGGCSLGWALLADLLYRARPGDQAGSARHRTYVELRARVREEDRRDYHGIHRDAADVGRSVLEAQWARARALRPGRWAGPGEPPVHAGSPAAAPAPLTAGDVTTPSHSPRSVRIQAHRMPSATRSRHDRDTGERRRHGVQ